MANESIFKFNIQQSNINKNKPRLEDVSNEVALASPFGEQSTFYTGIRSSFGSIPKVD